MSTDPTGLGNENCVKDTKKKYINIQFDKSDWCEYKGDCFIDNLVYGREFPCLLCKYRKPIDIPRRLDLKIREGEQVIWRKFT
jgi:hypothetical protein